MRNSLDVYTYLCSNLVTVKKETGTERSAIHGNLEEIGESNVLVLLDSPIRRGTRVTVSAGCHRLKGSVKSWNFEPDLGYFVEVQLTADSRWSKAWFTPQHLLGPWNEDADLHTGQFTGGVAA